MTKPPNDAEYAPATVVSCWRSEVLSIRASSLYAPARTASMGVPFGIVELNEDLAAVYRRDERLADDAEEHRADGEHEARRARSDDERAVLERPRKRAVRVPTSDAVEALAELVDDLPRFPVRFERPEAGERRRDVKETNSEVSVEMTTTSANSTRNLADLPLDERDRQEDDDVDERDDDRRDADLRAALDRPRPPAIA